MPRSRETDEIAKNFDYEHTELDALENRWRIAFGKEMLEELRNILIKGNCLDSYRIIQIKEKYGTLRWYADGASKEVINELNAWEEKYETKSAFTCIDCGKAATVVTTDYILPLCDDCYKEEAKKHPQNKKKVPIEKYYKKFKR